MVPVVLLAAGLGFEPRQTESESVVLPLHYPASLLPAEKMKACSLPQQKRYYHKESLDASINFSLPIFVLMVYNGTQVYHL